MDVTRIIPVYNEKIPITEICADDFLMQYRTSAFSEESVAFLDDMSQHILKTPDIRRYPELVSLAYWLRKGNIRPVISDFCNTIGENEVVVPRGVAFHIAPSNVDTIFLYSWALSMLAGNINIVRVSQSHSEQITLLFDVIRECIKFERYDEVAGKNIILTYKHDENISTFLSKRADIRILWGGDETISTIRSLPSKPTTKDIAFADKFSYCVIKATAYLQLTEEKCREIGRLFFNDAYWFDQMACSSPRIVYFIGDVADCEAASSKFWENIADELKQRRVVDTMPIAMNKLVFLYESVLEDINLINPRNFEYNKPSVVRIIANDRHIPSEHCGGGFFFECFLDKLNDLLFIVQPKDQTVTHFGFEKKDLQSFILSVGGKGVDRVVPVGQAMSFSPVWDGYVLLSELTKRVALIV
jgi:hypothetical protein